MSRPLTLLCCFALGGCVAHVARAVPPETGPTSAAVGTQVVDHFTAPIEERHALPRSLPVTLWSLDADGNLARGDLVIETPLPWWQRFPADVVSDMLLPGTLTAEASGTPTLQRVPHGDPTVLTEHARAAGYAAPAAKARHP